MSNSKKNKEMFVDPNMILVEGLIFAVGRLGIDRKTILEKVPVLAKSELEIIIDRLKEKYPNDGTSGVVLQDYGKVLSLATHVSIGEQVADALKRKKQRELSNSLLEVLSIVAYQQPITRAEIEQIREGKSCDYQICALAEAGLITVVGRKDTIGRPMLYGTTQHFLEKFELASLRKLPSRKDIEGRIAIIRTQADDGGNLFVDKGDFAEEGTDESLVAADTTEDWDEGAPVGAGEEADYDDTDYDADSVDTDGDDSAVDDETDVADDDFADDVSVDDAEDESADDTYDEYEQDEVWDDDSSI